MAWRCSRRNLILNPFERTLMRVLFLLIVIANIWVYALGQGWLGARPDDAGRDRSRFGQELNVERIRVGP